MNPLVVIMYGLPKVDPKQGGEIKKSLRNTINNRLDIPIYPEHLKLGYQGKGEERMTTGKALAMTTEGPSPEELASYNWGGQRARPPLCHPRPVLQFTARLLTRNLRHDSSHKRCENQRHALPAALGVVQHGDQDAG